MKLSIRGTTLLLAFLAMILGGCATQNTYDSWYYKGFHQDHPQTGNQELSSMGTKCYFCKGETTQADSDGDGVLDQNDSCPQTPAGLTVDAKGCPLDSDGDGVFDYLDGCPETPLKAKVDANGCPLDSDGDGVIDLHDQCPGTPSTVSVDDKGCHTDSDGDGVLDNLDRCPGTPTTAKVNSQGCWVLENLNFETGKSDINPDSYGILNKVVQVLKANSDQRVEVQGHTDNRGSIDFNKRLSHARAQSVVNYLVGQGISASRMKARGYGLDQPIADNNTSQGRAKNRRVELKPIQ